MIMLALFIAIIFGISIIVHEIGHYIVLKELAKVEPDIRFSFKEGFKVGRDKDYKKLSKDNYMYVHLVGIIAGFFPLLVLPGIYFWICFFIYAAVSRHDFLNIFRRNLED